MDIRRYQLAEGKVPVSDWLASLRDLRARAQIEIRLRRMAVGNFGDCKPVGDGHQARQGLLAGVEKE